MLKGTRRLILDTVTELPDLIKSHHSMTDKWRIFFTYLKISIKLFTIHRIQKITEEKILGFSVTFFDYGTLHFLFREIFICNNYYFSSKLNKPLIFDCGANIGMATIYFKWLYPKSTILAFEADPETFQLLKENIIRNNLKNIQLYNVALLDKNGKTNFYIDKDNPGWLTMSIIRDRLPKDKIFVNSSLLSSYVNDKRIDFLKMDIEGAEMKVLKELIVSNKLNNFKNMVIEYHHRIKGKSELSYFINLLEKQDFEYNLEAKPSLEDKRNIFQDILVRAYEQD